MQRSAADRAAELAFVLVIGQNGRDRSSELRWACSRIWSVLAGGMSMLDGE